MHNLRVKALWITGENSEAISTWQVVNATGRDEITQGVKVFRKDRDLRSERWGTLTFKGCGTEEQPV